MFDLTKGAFVDFKLHDGRGRPMLGQVIQNKGIFIHVKSPVTRKEILVPKGRLIRNRTPWFAQKANSKVA